MTEERFQQRFSNGLNNAIVEPADGSAPRRLDGKPLTDHDRQLLAGRDPVAKQIRALKRRSGAGP
jgi:hypothetical protein